MKTNIATWERLLRVLFGTSLIGAGTIGFSGSDATPYRVFAIVVALIGLDFVVTGAIGFCPLYHKLGWSTAPEQREVR